MRKLNFSGAAVSLSVLTTVMGQCILSGEAVSARTLLLQGLPMALALAVISRLLALAEVEQGTFSGNTFKALLPAGDALVWCGTGGNTGPDTDALLGAVFVHGAGRYPAASALGRMDDGTGCFLPKCRNFVVGCGSGGGHLLFQPERPAPLGEPVSGTGNDRTNAAADLRGILCSAALF